VSALALISNIPPDVHDSVRRRLVRLTDPYWFLIAVNCSQLRSHGVWIVQYANFHRFRISWLVCGVSFVQSLMYLDMLDFVRLAKNVVIRFLHARGIGRISCPFVLFFESTESFACFGSCLLGSVYKLCEAFVLRVCE